jgi:glycosyltransferase involved in cell wall biosynthesis
MVCKLSILICTIPERKHLFDELYKKVSSQSMNKSVQIIYDDAPKGTLTIGGKRNKLLTESIGEYVVFIDDDDDISIEYVDSILLAIDKAPDCIGFKIHCDIEGKSQMAVGSLKYKQWADKVDGYDYVRTPYHKTPVKRSIAIQCMFPDKSYGEDHEYSKRIYPLLKSEVFIDKVLYNYRYKYENPTTKYPK